MKQRETGNRSLREELVELETMSPHLREKYKQEVKAMIERKLTAWQRALHIFFALLGVVFMVTFGRPALLSGEELPWTARIVFGLGTVAGLILTIVCVVILRRGRFHIVRDSNIHAFLPYSIVLVAMVIVLPWAQRTDDQLAGIQVVLGMLVFFVMAVMFMIVNRVNQAEWKLREQLLRIELELAELAEKLGREDEGSRQE